MTSLIRQRQLIVGERTGAAVLVAVASVLVLLGVVTIAGDPAAWTSWLSCLAWTVLLVVGAVRLRTARRKLADFEAEHGRDAGVQRSVT